MFEQHRGRVLDLWVSCLLQTAFVSQTVRFADPPSTVESGTTSLSFSILAGA